MAERRPGPSTHRPPQKRRPEGTRPKGASGRSAAPSARATGTSGRPSVRKTTRTAPRPAARPATRRSAAGRGAPRRYRKTVRMPIGETRLRIRVFSMLAAVIMLVVGGRAVFLQGIDSSAYAATAAEKMRYTQELAAARGTITDRNGVVLATTEPAMIVSIDPKIVRTNGADERYPMSEKKIQEMEAAPNAVADLLVKHLGGKKSDYLKAIDTPDTRYKVVAKRVPAATYIALQADMKAGIDGDGKRPWYGVYSESDPIRVYPNRTVAASVIGFVNAEGKGATGLEYALDSTLRGTPGKQMFESSTYGRIPMGDNTITPAVDGASYELTIDSDVNWMAEQILANGLRKAGAKTGMAVAIDAKSGEILALVNNPSYDASNPGAADTADLGNRAVTMTYEPGSVQKVLTMAALADQGLVTADTRVEVPSRIASGDRYVRDSFEHGTLKLTARGVVAQSSNIGTIMMARQMEKSTLAEYLAKFGLGSKPGSGLPGESTGQLPGADMPDYTRDQVSFGQGLSVNAVQMTAAVAAAVNGGVYHQPSIIASGTQADGTPVELPTPASRRVISEEASAEVREMMEAVITLKEGREIPGYRTIGKSGTAQRYDADCKCYNGFTASFVGAAPAEDPQIVVYVVLDQPTNGNLGSQLALPVVNDILSMMLPRYNVAPSTTAAPDEPLTYD